MSRSAFAAATVLSLAGACTPGSEGNADAGPGVDGLYTLPSRPLCPGSYAGLPSVLGHLGDEALVELSGVVPSSTTPDLLWAHNDSGRDPVLFALHEDGSARGRLALPVSAPDVEDIATASCPDRSGPCLYLADTGNNSGERTDQAIYVVEEPPLPAGGEFPDSAALTRAWRIDASPEAGLPEGIDIEALAVLPDASALLLFEKIDAQEARVFALRAPFATRTVIAGVVDEDEDTMRSRFEEVGRVRTESPGAIEFARMITGASMHPSGRALALRTYSGVFELRLPDSDSFLEVGEQLATTVTFGPLTEPQGEAIAYDAAGTGILTISEARDDPAADVPVNLLPCQGEP